MRSFQQSAKSRTKIILELSAVGALVITLGACVMEDPNPPPRHVYYENGYPADRDRDQRSTYSGDYDEFNADRSADEKNGLGHSDDRNFHNRDDYQQYDR